MEAKDTVMLDPIDCDGVYCATVMYHNDKVFTELKDMLQAQAEISFKAGEEKEAKELRKVVDFAYGIAKAMDESKSSAVFFLIQQAFGETLGWDDAQEILTVIIEKSEAKLKEWGLAGLQEEQGHRQC